MPAKPVTKEKALERLASLCSRSEQCEYQLKEKLIRWGINEAERSEILEYLKENRYIDDERFARAYAGDKARFSNWGPYKIQLELRKLRIGNGEIRGAINNVPADVWKEGLLKNAEIKSKNLDLCGEEGYANRMKLYKYLIDRGFTSVMVTKAVALMKKRQEGEG